MTLIGFSSFNIKESDIYGALLYCSTYLQL